MRRSASELRRCVELQHLKQPRELAVPIRDVPRAFHERIYHASQREQALVDEPRLFRAHVDCAGPAAQIFRLSVQQSNS